MATSYNINPSPQQGNGYAGAVPGAVAAPPSVFDQLNTNIPGYGGLTTSATGDIQSELSGTLSPSTLSSIQNYAAARGVQLGQPNSNISNMIGLGLTGQTAEGLQQQGLSNYNTLTGTQGSVQQSPNLLADIAEGNAVNAAAPDPAQAAQYALSLYQMYMNPANGKSSFSYNPSGNAGGGGYSSGVSYGDFPDASGGGASNYASLVNSNAGY